ncbi:hypothetical protein A3742_20040, partial [Oleiphilus sp. HI0071]
MGDYEQTDIPVWISDFDEVRDLLSQFIDKLEKGTRLLMRLTEKNVPSLFDYNNPHSKAVWSLIQRLESDYGVFSIELDKHKFGSEKYENAKVRFLPDAEETVRYWLNRPKVVPYKNQWQIAVESQHWPDAVNVAFLSENPLFIDERSALHVAESLSKLAHRASSDTEPQTLRALSAAHFWGDSKFLDNKRDYLQSALPDCRLKERPLLVNIFVPEDFSSVLFIENQDTFLMLVTKLSSARDLADEFKGIALVYAAGFKGAAARIRDKSGYVFSEVSRSPATIYDSFTRWWELESDKDIPAYFWGDLDYSGFAILSALRGVFEGMEAWEAGYEVMLRFLD